MSRVGAALAVAGGIAVAAALGGCATRDPTTTGLPEPRTAASASHRGSGPVVGLVLSGGSARGYAHVGAIQVLEEAGIRPDLIVGTSAGSLVGALFAAGADAGELERFAHQADWSLLRTLALPRLGFVRSDRLREFVNERVLRRPMEHFPIRFAAVATDFQIGEMAGFDQGEPGLAVQASSSIPGVFEPVEIEGRFYVDGGLVSPLPVEVARELGATLVIAVDVVYPAREAAPSTPLGALWQLFLIQTERIKELERPRADIVIAPRIAPTSGQYGFGDREHLMRAGAEAAREALPRIHRALELARTP